MGISKNLCSLFRCWWWWLFLSYFVLFCLNKLHKDDSYNMAKVPTKEILKCPKILEGPLKYNIRKNNVLVASVNLGQPGRSRMSLGKGGFFFWRLWGSHLLIKMVEPVSFQIIWSWENDLQFQFLCLWSGSNSRPNHLNVKKVQDHGESALPSIYWWNCLSKLDPWVWRAARGLRVIESQQNAIWNVHGECFRCGLNVDVSRSSLGCARALIVWTFRYCTSQNFHPSWSRLAKSMIRNFANAQGVFMLNEIITMEKGHSYRIVIFTTNRSQNLAYLPLLQHF